MSHRDLVTEEGKKKKVKKKKKGMKEGVKNLHRKDEKEFCF